MERQGPSGPAIVALVLGILSLTGGSLFTGIPAWIVGSDELRRIRRGRSSRSGHGLAYAGTVLGIVGTVVGIGTLAVVAWITTNGFPR